MRIFAQTHMETRFSLATALDALAAYPSENALGYAEKAIDDAYAARAVSLPDKELYDAICAGILQAHYAELVKALKAKSEEMA